MIRKTLVLFFAILLLVNMSGCVALIVGAAGGAGTAGWLSGKLTQELDASFDKTLKATTSALGSLKLDITKETTKDDVAQVMSQYSDGRTIWIDVHKVSDKISRIEIRVGMTGDLEVSRNILDKIERYL
ncbi:MAG: DUF3568 family protein [Candidatus Omnitrophota bacterium]